MLSGELFCSDCTEPPSGAGSLGPRGSLGVASAAPAGAPQGARPAAASERPKREVTEAVTWQRLPGETGSSRSVFGDPCLAVAM